MSKKVKPLNAAPRYRQCPTCGFLSDDPLFEKEGTACPKCDSTKPMRRNFPTDRIRRLDTRIRRYHDEEEHEIVVILVAAFLEAVLEDILDRIMISHGGDLAMRRLLLDGQRSIGGRLGRLFPKLTGQSFEEIAGTCGFADFPGNWKEIRRMRNAFIHDSPFRGPQETLDAALAKKAMRLLDQSYRLLVMINNEYVINGGLNNSKSET